MTRNEAAPRSVLATWTWLEPTLLAQRREWVSVSYDLRSSELVWRSTRSEQNVWIPERARLKTCPIHWATVISALQMAGRRTPISWLWVTDTRAHTVTVTVVSCSHLLSATCSTTVANNNGWQCLTVAANREALSTLCTRTIFEAEVLRVTLCSTLVGNLNSTVTGRLRVTNSVWLTLCCTSY